MTSNDPCSFVNNISKTLYFNPVREDEIISIISKFKNKSAGYDEIEAKVVKYVKESLILPLLHICSISLSNGVLPDVLKISCSNS